MKALILFLACVSNTGCITETITVHAKGECPNGASVYTIDPARWQVKLCSFSGVVEWDGMCIQDGPDVVCKPLCNEGPAASVCDTGEHYMTFDQVCYCEDYP